MSEVKVNKVTPRSGTAVQLGDSGDTFTVPSGATLTTTNATVNLPNTSVTNANLAGSIDNAKLSNSAITINGSAVSLGGSVTVGETKPTISSISPSTIENSQTAVTLTGTNYVSIPYVDAINSSTGTITTADSVSFTSATTIVATFTLATDGTYYLRVENNDGNAVRSSTALLTVSDAPSWTTSAGSLGSNGAASAISYTVAATGDAPITYSKTSGSFPGGVSINSSTGVISGTESGSTQDTTYNFTITATDAQTQTAARAFSITITHLAQNSLQFN
tara:strand:- start:210 stop:1040 length:831 start_codon:yes stop_codon:yes gene_type:complete